MTGSLVAGSIWAFIELGTRWIGEPRITISFITWGIYLAMVFFRASAGWRGRKAAIMALVALVCSALTWAAHARLESHLS
jgi:ABC-type transport system involved in cytochrome c biogenesis permease subunit